MITEGYVPYLYTQINYKAITVSKGAFHFKYVPNNEENKLKQTKNDIKEGSCLSYRSITKYTFSFLNFFIFHQINLLNLYIYIFLFRFHLVIFF